MPEQMRDENPEIQSVVWHSIEADEALQRLDGEVRSSQLSIDRVGCGMDPPFLPRSIPIRYAEADPTNNDHRRNSTEGQPSAGGKEKQDSLLFVRRPHPFINPIRLSHPDI